jgi:GTP-binding protein
MFTDTVSLRVRAGRGGRGSASFRAQPFEPMGGPDGGNGGTGGDVVLRATRDLHDLSSLVQRAQLAATDGQHGAGGRKEGRDGADLTIRVPVGTAVFDAATGDLLGDLAGDGDAVVVATGGPGGGGNIHRASSINRTPTAAGPGDAGEQRELRLELWLPADIALVGKPNAGKSTLLSALTAARPKIADYAYTTPFPELGVMFAGTGRPTTLVEIPSERYVRHIERTRAVALVVDARHPEDLKAIQPLAGDRPTLVIWTKSDLVAGPHRRRGVWVSAETGEGVEELRAALLETLAAGPPRPRKEAAPRRVSLAPTGRRAAIAVDRRDWGLEVAGKQVERLLERYDLDTPAGFDRFQVALDRMGVTAALEEAGAAPGDTVRIGDAEFEYQP